MAIEMVQRFRGYYPVVIDVETGGFNHQTDALLEIAAVCLGFDEHDQLVPVDHIHFNVEPFAGANLEQSALDFTGIDPFNPLRAAVDEKIALQRCFTFIRKFKKPLACNRAILVGHNPSFDLSFLKAAVARTKLKRNPFHLFSTFDTATLGGLVYGQTVLAKACESAGIGFDNANAHSALYDAQKTAELFCNIVNRFHTLGGWPPGDLNNPSDGDSI